MDRVSYFEFVADDVERLQGFFKDIFGWEFTAWKGDMEYWMVNTGDEEQAGINGGMMRRQENFPSAFNSITVDDLEATLAAVKKQGGEVVVEKVTIPGIGYHAYFKDPEGTVWGIHQEDVNAGGK